MKIGRGNRSTRRKPAPSATLSTTNPTWPDPCANTGHRGGKPATNRLSYGAANNTVTFTPKLLIILENSKHSSWTKWRWGRFSPSTSVSSANLHSTNFSIIIITRGRYKRPFSGRRAEWTQFGLHPPLCEIKAFFSPKDGGDMFLRNVGLLSANFTALYPIRQNSS
jgi:hypothetical protein